MDQMNDNLNSLIEGNFTKNWDYCADIERTVTETLSRQKKTVDNMRFELVEIIDTKQENMQRMFDMELSRVKSAYDDAVEKVDYQSKTLESEFKNKVRAIKEKAALFFAKVELKLKSNNEETLEVSQMFRSWQENSGGIQKFDAQMFSVNSKLT